MIGDGNRLDNKIRNSVPTTEMEIADETTEYRKTLAQAVENRHEL